MSGRSSETAVILPDQLFERPLSRRMVLVEDRHFFSDLRFHKKKLLLHRASMMAYRREMAPGARVEHVEHAGGEELRAAFDMVMDRGGEAVMWEVCDHALRERVLSMADDRGASLRWERSPKFLFALPDVEAYATRSGRLSMTSFYIAMRKERGILVEGGRPVGGKWSLDPQNRRVPPPGTRFPSIPPLRDDGREDAAAYVEERFPDNPGDTGGMIFPVNREQARAWLDDFVVNRLPRFGDHQDAIMVDERHLFHSLLSAPMNIGLLTPGEVLDRVMERSRKVEVPLNSLEGFVRQVLGWREFVRGVHMSRGREMMEANFWGHRREMPEALYRGETGIDPVDVSVRNVMDSGYAHHIERLMVLGKFMLLCGIAPGEVYRWFMEMFIDAYEWVMVPNVMGMSQFADGGGMSTKPYISSSRYILRMGDHRRGEWSDIMDSLFWRFVHLHRDFFDGDPRMKVMVSQLRRMEGRRLEGLLGTAEGYLEGLWTREG